MPRSGNRALHNENVRPCLLRNLAEFNGTLRDGTHRRERAAILNLAHACRDQVLLDWFLVNPLQQRGNFGFVCLYDFLQDFLRILVARLHSFEI